MEKLSERYIFEDKCYTSNRGKTFRKLNRNNLVFNTNNMLIYNYVYK